VAIANLVRLSLLTENLAYRDQAEQALKAFGTVMEQVPRACPSLFIALDWWLHGTVARITSDAVAALSAHYLPTTVLVVAEDLAPGTVGIVCRGTACLEPAQSPEQLLSQLIAQ
jgi:uncharacterized protein YyaL (SSP411 family)